MDSDSLGKLFSLLNALTWAFALVFFKQSGDRIPPLALNLFKNLVGIALIGMTIAILPVFPPLPPTLNQAPPAWLWDFRSIEMWTLIISGVLGIAIADTIFFYGLNLAGVGLIAIVDCTYTPFVMLFSWLMLGEIITGVHLLGAGLIIVAVLISSGHAPPADRTRGQIVTGIVLAISAVGLMALGIVYATPVLRTAPALWTSQVRLLGGTAALLLIAPLLPHWRETLSILRPSSRWRAALPAGVFGAYLAMVFWVAGFSMTSASIAATLNQSSSIIALLLAAIVLGEKLTLRKGSSVVLALSGVLVMVFHQQVGAWMLG